MHSGTLIPLNTVRLALLGLLGGALLAGGCTQVIAPRECAARDDCARFGGVGADWQCTAGRCEAVERCTDDSKCGPNRVCVSGDCVAATQAPDVGPTPPGDDRPRVVVTGAITGDTRWDADTVRILGGTVVVEEAARLTITAGSRVEARVGGALVVRPGGQLHVEGTAQRPVVFTSAKQPGLRSPGDWNGIALLGSAPTNDRGARFGGLDDGVFGGPDRGHRCGILEYLRVEFAGGSESALTLAGCGSGTLVDHVQIHASAAHGISMFGGTVNGRHLVATEVARSGLYWTLGWTGRVQFVIIQMDEQGQAGMTGVNQLNDHDATPRSAPMLSHATIVGSPFGDSVGLHLRDGTAADIVNSVVTGTTSGTVDVTGLATAEQFLQGNLRVRSALLASDDASPFPVEMSPSTNDDAPDVDGDGAPDRNAACSPATQTADCGAGFDCDGTRCSFDEARAFAEPRLDNRFGESPLSLPLRRVAPADAGPSWTPNWTPDDDERVRSPAHLEGDFWDAAPYLGAFAPAADGPSWAAGWTAFPEK